ncbi:ribosome silencing factor [Ideonella sp. 4Y11]|uniref:Ribosomal silencing factor RsfS n=1 Tax=Ideonella aquatica TaxID=2824119 RepID=A0A941BQW1_9BURK|nr:ribosome silencing factor [Ideonella aquatica]MBQ0959595.1 ribosome silencing factor [Ideonella aquatica]
MDIRKLQRAIVDGLEDVKAQDILVFNTEHLSPLFERVIIASGTSNRQTKALSSSVREEVKAAGFDVPRCEGEDNGEWIIVDCGAAVCHIMQPAIRDYYRLEEIWGGKPVKMKLGDAKTGLVKASEGSDAAAKKKAPAKKASATARSAAGQAALEKPAKAAKPAKPAPARKVTAGGLASAKAAPRKAASATTAPKKAATRSTSGTVAKAPARKSAAAKTPMKLVVVKPAAKKTAAKKATPKKTGR